LGFSSGVIGIYISLHRCMKISKGMSTPTI